jgi:hypothetical protein
MRLSWDIDVRLIKLLVISSRNFTNVFNDILKEYGYEKIVELGIDLYGGCFNFRKMRRFRLLTLVGVLLI